MKTLILTHGALGSKADLDKLASVLKVNNYNVFTFSFSGHGGTNFEKDFGIKQFSIELENFILKNHLIKPSVVGYSMGGYVALYLALRAPDIFDKIITLGTKFSWTKEVVEKETRVLVPKVMLEKIPSFARSLELKHGNGWKELLIKTSQMMYDINLKNYLDPEALKNIQNKILLGLGDKDQMVTLEETVNVYKLLPDANMYMLPNTKHPIEHLNTALFAEIIKEFLGS